MKNRLGWGGGGQTMNGLGMGAYKPSGLDGRDRVREKTTDEGMVVDEQEAEEV